MKPFDYEKYLQNNPLLKENLEEVKIDMSIDGIGPEMFDLEDTIYSDPKGNIDNTRGWPRLYNSWRDKDIEDFRYIADELQFILKRNPKKLSMFTKFIKNILSK